MRNSVWFRSENVLSSAVGHDVAILDIAGGQYFGLENVGARVWEYLESPRSGEWLLGQLEKDYEVSGVESEIVKFFDELVDNKLVKKSDTLTDRVDSEPVALGERPKEWIGLQVFSVSTMQTAAKDSMSGTEMGDTVGPS